MRGCCAIPQRPSSPSRSQAGPGPVLGRRAAVLHQKQAGEENDRNRYHIGLEERGGDFQPLDRAQHRNGGRDDAVAIEQRGADQARRHDPQVPFASTAGAAQRQRGKRKQSAFAAVVGAHDDEHVFHRDHQHQRPDDQRERAENGTLAQIAEINKRLADGVERRGADIAIDDAERGDRQARAGAQVKIALLRRRVQRQRVNSVGRHSTYAPRRHLAFTALIFHSDPQGSV